MGARPGYAARMGGDSREGSGDGNARFDIEHDLLCTADSNGYFVSLNAGWERLLGWSREELMARPFIEFVHPDDVEDTFVAASKVTHLDYELVNFENRYRAKSGDYRWLRWSARSDGRMWFAVAFDITEAKEREDHLRSMLTDQHLLAYSQPIVEGRSRNHVQEELLVRMKGTNGNTGRVIPPGEFLPEAERCGLVDRIDRWMLAKGIGLADMGRRTEVNLSAVSIGDPATADELADAIRQAGRNVNRLVFEITETAAIENLDAALDFTERLTRMGCSFALDDFGTGYGSLTHLRQLPVSYLKIDTSFVRRLSHSSEDQAMVRGIVAIARELDVRTVAEGIEDEETLEILRDAGVDYAQGYLIGHPAPLA